MSWPAGEGLSIFESANIFILSCFRLKCHCREGETAIFFPRLSSLLERQLMDVTYESGAADFYAVADGVDSPYRGSYLFAHSIDSSGSIYSIEIRSSEPQYRKDTRCSQLALELYSWLASSDVCESTTPDVPSLWK